MERSQSMEEVADSRWLVLIHQIPPKPDYLRVKVWRRLQRLGAVAIKNSVYVLPEGDQPREDLQWVSREIVEDGGEATICSARFVEGLSDGQVEAMFRNARDGEYAQMAEEARRLMEPPEGSSDLDREQRAQIATACSRLNRRLAEVTAVDFFGAPGREAATRVLSALEARLRPPSGTGRQAAGSRSGRRGRTRGFRGRTWVTRKGIHVDRIASAWLIRRFIDRTADFKFVPARGYHPKAGELRFDMFEAEYTHRGDRCTFEVLMDEFRLEDPALRQVAQVVHDIDLKDSKYSLPETAGIERLITGVGVSHRDDETRLARGSVLFDLLFTGLGRHRR